MICPECDSEHIVRNGVRKNGKQNHLCRLCDRQFVENPLCHYRIPEEKRDLVDRLLLEKIPLAGIIGGPHRFLNDGFSTMSMNSMKMFRKNQR